MSLLLCVDCGGSKTAAVICDALGNIVARANGGPSNRAYLGDTAFVAAVKETVQSALAQIQLTLEAAPFASALFGISGVDSPADISSVTPLLSNLLRIPAGPRLQVANDTHLLAAPIWLHPNINSAIAVIAGTGSICVAFSAASNRSIVELGRIGGWGWLLGDEGGGFHVGREAIRQIILAHDLASIKQSPAPESSLTRAVMQLFKVENVSEILALVHYPDPVVIADSSAAVHLRLSREKRLSSLSPLVFHAAFEEHDPLALHVLKTCADILAGEIFHLLADPKKILASESVISFGGSLVGIEKYRNLILDSLKESGHVFRHVEYVADAAAVGAVSLATNAPGS